MANESIDLLKSIDASLKAILAGLRQGATTAQATTPANPWNGTQPTAARASNVPRVASEADLSGPYGDPQVRAKSPRDWTGPDMMSRKFSECPAEYLDLVAERLDYFATQNELAGDPESLKKAHYNRLDSGRARGWSARIRAGYKPAGTPPSDDFGEAPF